jgi:hypothetical protein
MTDLFFRSSNLPTEWEFQSAYEWVSQAGRWCAVHGGGYAPQVVVDQNAIAAKPAGLDHCDFLTLRDQQ